MNCEHCQELISAFLDNELDEKMSACVQTHLGVCAECAKICEDFAVLLDVCHFEEPVEEIVPPNAHALWCRISNVIENEVNAELKAEEQKKQKEEFKQGWFSKAWQLSFSQVASAVLGIALVSSLLTVVGIKNYNSAKSKGDDFSATVSTPPSFFDRALAKVGLIESSEQIRERKIQEQKAAIEYWSNRVQQRRLQWDANLRQAFDRNLNEIDQAVNEYTLILQENPQDELSGEMLDTALNEKMELLREFSDL